MEGCSPAPDLAKWLGGRAQRTEKAAEPIGDTPVDPATQAKAQAKARAARDRKRTAGLEDLELWLSDLVREGLQAARARPYGDWDRQAARLVDAQLPGVARLVRLIPEWLHDETGEMLTAHLGRLWLLTQGWRQREELSEAERADLLTALGAPLDRGSLPPAAPQVWQALGSVQEEEGKLNVRRTWLLGALPPGEGPPGGEPKPVLLLDFAPTGQGLPPALAPHQPFTAAVAYAPSAYPQRAVVQGEVSAAGNALPLPDGTLTGMQERYAAALALNPWLERIGVFVGPAYLHLDPPQLCDAEGYAVPLSPRVDEVDLWAMLAQAETQMQTYFGEWDGKSFLPVGAVQTEVDVTGAETGPGAPT